jgi:hypothetical protein
MGISRKDILDATNGGLDVIAHYLPEAVTASKSSTLKFRTGFRDGDSTPSATMWKAGDEWIVKDFGDKSYSCFDFVMVKERLDYPGAIRWIVQQFDIEVEKAGAVHKYEYEKKVDVEGEVGAREWGYMNGYSVSGMRTLFSKYVWEYLGKKDRKKDEVAEDVAFRNAVKICERYGLKQLDWSSIVSIDQKSGKKVQHIFKATDTYPIYVWEVEWTDKDEKKVWRKFYEPFGSMRFSSYGEKPEKYIFGMAQCAKAFDEIPNDYDIMNRLNLSPDDFGDDKDVAKVLGLMWEKRNPKKKLPEIVICSGGSDGLNVAALGYQVVWFNSEKFHKSDVPFEKLSGWAYKVINLPDIDEPGLEEAQDMASTWIDMHTSFLPKELRRMKSGKKDEAGKPKYCKDVKDYLERYTSRSFDELMKDSKPLKFWNKQVRYDSKDFPVMEDGEVVYKYTPKPSLLLNFLYHSGFGILKSADGEYSEFVRVVGNVVSRIKDTDDIKKFVDKFLTEQSKDNNLYDAFYRSKDISEAIFSRLPGVELDFQDFDKEYQYMFFDGEVWIITGTQIEKKKPHQVRKHVWEHEVIKPTYWHEKDEKRKAVEVSLKDDFFSISEEDGKYSFKVLENDCLYFKYLINTSRIHWRTELEENLDKEFNTVGERNEYRKKHQFDIAGPLLNAEQIEQQERNLLVKVLAIGYMMHRYKRESNAKVVWAMDYVMRDISKSQGGTGKSLTPRGLQSVLPTEYLSGRDKNVLSNKHVFENLSEYIDMLFLDDAGRDTDFEFFFGAVTGPMKTNPKGTKGRTIDFKDSPKIWITSNYPPMKGDEDSTMRRIWFTAYSDFYHYNNSGQYRSEHKPEDDFGKQLFLDFNNEDWNNFLNFLAQCCKAFIRFGIVESKDHSLLVNTYRNMIGDQFMEWADVYFNKEDSTLDAFLRKQMIYEDYIRETNSDMKANGFKSRLELWCRMKHYQFNPRSIERGMQADGRISAKQTHDPVYDRKDGKWDWKPLPKATSKEFVYIQTSSDVPVNYDGLDLYGSGNKVVEEKQEEVKIEEVFQDDLFLEKVTQQQKIQGKGKDGLPF